MPEPEIRELAAQPALFERATTDAPGLATTIDRAFPALFGRLATEGVMPAGAPFIRYLEIGEQLDIELGVPVPAAVEEIDGVELMSLPAGRAAILRYTGPYDGLADAGERLASWVEQRHEEPSGPHWEVYLTDPKSEPDASKWITDICLPLR